MTKERRPATRTIDGWARSVLLETGAIRECEEHAWMRDRTDRMPAIVHFSSLATIRRSASLRKVRWLRSKTRSGSIDDTCPECPPDGQYAVIRQTIRSMDKVGLARLVLTSREHVISLEARDKGLMGMLLRYPYEVRDQAEYFDDIQDVKITKDMLDLARHIVEQKSGHFDPSKFEDHYEAALQDLLNKKQKGQPIPKAAPRRADNVVDLMSALRASIKGSDKDAKTTKARPAKKAKPARRKAS
jgi:hypothetical protein